jgi:hypothetical protein
LAALVVCVAGGLAAAFTQYVHSGYLGVVEGSSPIRLLGRGLHLRAPWRRVVFYPVESETVGIKTVVRRPGGTVTAELTIIMSVSGDSVASLHAAYGGKYVEALVVPQVNEFLRLRADAWGDWQRRAVVDRIDQDLASYVDAQVAPRGINIYHVWLRSYEISNEQID